MDYFEFLLTFWHIYANSSINALEKQRQSNKDDKQIFHMRKTCCCSSLFTMPFFLVLILLTCFNQSVHMIELGMVSEVK